MSHISVVITTKNEALNIGKLLTSIDSAKKWFEGKLEVIVVDSLSEDNTAIIAEEHPIVDRVICSKCSIGRGRNIGLREISPFTNIVAFVDGDAVVDKLWLREIEHSYKMGMDISSGYVINQKKPTLPRVPIIVDGQDITAPTCNIAYRKEVINSVGDFNENLKSAEDIDYNYRCIKKGFTMFYNPHQIVYHGKYMGTKELIRKSFRDGYGRRQLMKLYPELKINQGGFSPRYYFRLGFGMIGYVYAYLRE